MGLHELGGGGVVSPSFFLLLLSSSFFFHSLSSHSKFFLLCICVSLLSYSYHLPHFSSCSPFTSLFFLFFFCSSYLPSISFLLLFLLLSLHIIFVSPISALLSHALPPFFIFFLHIHFLFFIRISFIQFNLILPVQLLPPLFFSSFTSNLFPVLPLYPFPPFSSYSPSTSSLFHIFPSHPLPTFFLFLLYILFFQLSLFLHTLSNPFPYFS